MIHRLGVTTVPGNLTVYKSQFPDTVFHPLERKGKGFLFCAMDQLELCNGVSVDLLDECDCGSDVFLCHDGSGCLAQAQVCDKVVDCTDGSDECVCLSYLNCEERFSFETLDIHFCTPWKPNQCNKFHYYY